MRTRKAPPRQASHPTQGGSGLVLYWLTILTIAVLSVFASGALAILLFAIGDSRALLVVAVFGLMFGHVTFSLLRAVDALEARHRVFAAAFIPLAAIANIVAVTSAANGISVSLNLGSQHNPALVGAAYGAAFVLPWLVAPAVNFIRVRQGKN